jgi:flagellar basal-body rod protein FlgB
MNAYSLRQRSLADNIANVDTPGFQRSEVSFEKDLKKVISGRGVKGATTHDKHIDIGIGNVRDLRPKIQISKDQTLASGKNNVNIDKEMAELAKNSIRFQAASQLMSRTFTKLKSAIRGEAVR